MTDKLDTLQSFEIAEGVEIRLRLAGPVVRGLAFLIDLAIKLGALAALSQLVALFGISLAFMFGGETGFGVMAGLTTIGTFALEWGYSIGFEMSRWGGTPGKRALGLRVTRTSGAPVTLNQSVIRNMLRMIDMLPVGGIAGAISCLLSPRFQRLGDLAADTVVIYSEDRVRAPFENARWEDVHQVRPGAALTREEQGAIVQFAERVEDWSEPRAEELAALAQPLTRESGPDGVRRILGMALWIRDAG